MPGTFSCAKKMSLVKGMIKCVCVCVFVHLLECVTEHKWVVLIEIGSVCVFVYVC